MKSHFVLYISQVGNPREKLQFILNIIQMPSFGTALAYLEERTVVMDSVTSHLGRKPTPPSSPPKVVVDESDIAETFEKVSLEEVA